MQNFSFLKTEFGIFQFQAPGNPGLAWVPDQVPSSLIECVYP